MSPVERKRLERLHEDLLWLVSFSSVEVPGALRDAVGELRYFIEEAVDA